MSTPIVVGIDATTWWNDRGFGRFTRGLLRALIQRSDRFRYVLFVDRDPGDALPDGASVEVVAVQRTLTESAVGESSRSLAYAFAMGRALTRATVDILFFPAVYSYVPIWTRTPAVVAFHDTIAEQHPELVLPTRRNRWLWRLKTRLALWQARRVMTVSLASAADLERIFAIDRSRIDVVSEAADPHFHHVEDAGTRRAARERCGVPPEVPHLIYVGGLNPHKNLLRLLRAFPTVLEAYPETHLSIVGDTSGSAFYDNVAELRSFVDAHAPLASRVHFTGFVSEGDLVALYSDATALVLPSLNEGFGLPALEAMACGLPVLASDRGSLPEVIGDAGRLFDPTSPEEIAAVITRFLEEPGCWRELSERGLARAREFSWERGAELAEACFLRCLDDPAEEA